MRWLASAFLTNSTNIAASGIQIYHLWITWYQSTDLTKTSLWTYRHCDIFCYLGHTKNLNDDDDNSIQ